MVARRLLPLAAGLLVLAACESSGTEPLAEPLLFQGELPREGHVEHYFTLAGDGLVQIDVLDLQQRLDETGEVSDFTGFLRAGLGRRAIVDEMEQCAETSPLEAFREGSTYAFHLERPEHCLEILDICEEPDEEGDFDCLVPEGHTILYSVQVATTE